MAKTAKQKRKPSAATAKRWRARITARDGTPVEAKGTASGTSTAAAVGDTFVGTVVEAVGTARNRTTKDRLKPRQELCRRIFQQIFPNGQIPDEVELSTLELRGMIADELDRAAKETGKKRPPTPSWDVVRAARRNPKTPR